ncbi:MAG: transporter substrate-binding domain-containing protein, partial [Ilumatobacteraceae bacterium]
MTTRTKHTAWRQAAAAAAVIALFAGACGGDDDDGADDGATADEPAGDEPAAEDAGGDDAGSDAPAAEDSGSDEPAAEDSGSDDGGDDEVEVTQGGGVLDAVIARGTLKCGVSGAAVAFSQTNAEGRMEGIDAEYCRAVAAAVLGDAEAVEFIALTAAERFTAVQTGDVDVLMRNSTWTQSRDTEVGMDFGPTTYYDGQQLMGRASDGF